MLQSQSCGSNFGCLGPLGDLKWQRCDLPPSQLALLAVARACVKNRRSCWSFLQHLEASTAVLPTPQTWPLLICTMMCWRRCPGKARVVIYAIPMHYHISPYRDPWVKASSSSRTCSGTSATKLFFCLCPARLAKHLAVVQGESAKIRLHVLLALLLTGCFEQRECLGALGQLPPSRDCVLPGYGCPQDCFWRKPEPQITYRTQE